jgi:hypothetical protein
VAHPFALDNLDLVLEDRVGAEPLDENIPLLLHRTNLPRA